MHTRGLLLFFLPLLLAGCGSTQEIQQGKIDSTLAEAQRQALLGRTREARQWADRAIAIDPGALSTYVSKPLAATLFVVPDQSDVHLSIADIFGAAGDDRTVNDYMAQAARRFPRSDWPLFAREQAQGRLGDVAGQRATAAALAASLEARVVRPGTIPDATLMIELGQAQFDAGDPVRGGATFHRVLTTFPYSPHASDAMNFLAYDYADAGDVSHLPEALALAVKAFLAAQKAASQGKIDAASVGAVQDTLGWVQFRLGDYPQALANLQQAMSLDPREPENRYHLAMTYKALGSAGAARSEFQRAVLLSPGYAAPAKELAALPAPSSAAPFIPPERPGG